MIYFYDMISKKKTIIVLLTALLCSASAQVTLQNDTIPVIIHVIHANENYGSGSNLDSSQVYSQFKVLNQDFNGVGYNVQNVPAVWQSLIAVTGIKFVPALLDPNGNLLPEPGIERIPYNSISGLSAPGSGYSMTTVNTIIKPATGWPPSLYCNIWVLKLAGGMTAYSTFPNSSGLPWLGTNPGVAVNDSLSDGIVCHFQFFGDTLNVMAPFNKGRSVTHEMGHWLGLIHFYQGCGAQYLPDLPPGDYNACIGCPAWPCTAGVCAGFPDGPMYNNFMIYSDDACMNMFTDLQGDTMVYVLHHAQYKNNLQNSWVYHTLPTFTLENNVDVMKIYPNPGTGEFFLDSKIKNVKIKNVINSLGEKFPFEFNHLSGKLKLNSPPGIYFLVIEKEGGNLLMKLLVENH